MYKVLYILLLFVAFPVSAQDRFVTLNWQELPAPQTLPTFVESIPLPDDFSSYTYQVNIEFPEFSDLDNEAITVLTEKKTTLPAYPQAETSVGISAHEGFLHISLVPVVYRNGVYQRINSFKLSIVRTPVLATRAVTSLQTTKNSVLSSGRFVKIRISDSGVYGITYAELRKMGFASPDKVRLYGYGGNLLSQKFAEHPADDLPEVPVYRGGDRILFYGLGPVSWKRVSDEYIRVRNFYSDYGYYFLTEGEQTPAQFPVVDPIPSEGMAIDTLDAFALYEKDAFSWANSGQELYDDYDYATGNSQKYTFQLPGIVAEADGKVKVVFAANLRANSGSTTLSAAVDGNGQSKGSMVISCASSYYVKAVEGTTSFKWAGNKSETTTLTLTHTRPSGVSGRLNYIILNYQRKLQLNGSFLAFRSSASTDKVSTFAISGATSSTVVWDVTSPADYKLIKGVLNGSTYTFTIPASKVLREFVAVNTSASFSGVETVGDVPNQNLHGLPAVDMVIITPDKQVLSQQAERLAQAHRGKDKLSVLVIPATQIYNEFSSGTPDATAYRRLMKMFYDRYTSEAERPKYLLLFGDCSYDNRMISSPWKGYKTSDFLLCHQYPNSVDERESFMTDDYFGFLDNEEGSVLERDLLDISIGRFPVRTVDEAKNAVDKTITYMENRNAGSWKRTVCYVTDDPEKGYNFQENANDVAEYVSQNHPQFKVERVFADAYKREASATGMSFPGATKRLLQLFGQGMLIVNYTGHSGPTSWAAENLLTSADVVKLSSPRLPFWFTASCDFTRFDDLATSAGELAFLNPKGGAIALFSTSRVVFDDKNGRLNKALHNHLFARPQGKRLRLGDIARLAKRDMVGDDNKLNFNLVGDPALTLAYPDYEVKVDEFDGPLTDEMPYMKAGGRVTVRGHILTPEGTPADDFNGVVHPLVLDSKERVNTLNHSGDFPYSYIDQSKVLFSGMDSVRNGRFEITFPVPLDINYSNEQGMLKLYACDSNRQEAGGAFDRFLVGGTADDISSSDPDGPKMNIYLNTPDFPWGGQVNETPFFVADLEDEDGINTVGNGIGHDLSLCIDGRMTYSLNDYYTPVAGSYTKGAVAFSIPALSEGKHSLSFRAWDIMNRSSLKTLEFEVVKGLRPDLFSITCSKSPARENTTFIISHDRPGSEIAVRIAVCDFAGRELWVHTEQGVSTQNYYYVDWDLCSNLGRRLSPGVYLYRASITSEGSEESTKTEKIVILAQ